MAKRGGRGLWLISCAVLVICLAWVGEANAAPQDFNQLLRGDYAFTGEAFCVISPSGFTNFTPNGEAFFRPFSIQGTRTFGGDGTGTVVFKLVGIRIGDEQINANSAEGSGDFTYTVAPDRSVTIDQGPVTTTGVAGPGAGSVSVLTGVKFSGQLSSDGKTLIFSTEGPSVETSTGTNPDGSPSVRYQICTRARTAIKIH